MNAAWIILGMALVTFPVRAVFFVLGERLHFSDTLKTALRFVPVTVLTAIVVPMLVLTDGQPNLSWHNPWLVAGLCSIAIAKLQHRPLVTIVAGLCVFFGWQWAGL